MPIILLRLFLPFVLLLTGCGGSDTSAPSTGAAPANTAPQVAVSVGEPVAGQEIFVIVPAESKASYLANEEFFAGALKKLGITAGKRKVVGSTQAIEGQFQLSPERPLAGPGDNTFTVRMDTFTTDRPARDNWIREEGPSFYAYPLAIFKATAIEGGSTPYRAGDELDFHLAGTLTIREITKPATFSVKARLAGDTLTGVATTRLLMSDFGIEELSFFNTLTVADEIGIELQFTARARPK